MSKSTFEKDYFNLLINNYGFFIEEIGEGDNSLWMAVKTVNDGGIYSVIISKEEDEQENFNRAKEHLELKGVPYSLHNIILFKNRKIGQEEQGDDFNVQTGYHRVLLDVSSKKVSQYDKNSEPLVRILGQLFQRKEELKKPWYKRIKIGKTTAILIALNVIFFLGSVIVAGVLTGDYVGNLMEIDGRVLYKLGAKETMSIVAGGQIWRLLTSMFLHGGLVHLLFNMYALYVLGDTIESIYGRKKYLAVYFLSGIIASLASVIFSPYSISVGASGAIFGLLGAALVFALHEKHRIGKQFLINIIVIIALNVVIGFGPMSIDNSAHIGGLLGGVILSFFFYRYQVVRRVN